MRRAVVLWLVLFAAYAATVGLPAFGTSQFEGDEPHYLLTAESIVSDGDIDVRNGAGDRVIIYMPLTPEGIISMLACARLGAIHSVVFAGMGVQALRSRIEDCEARVIVCADFAFRRGKALPLKPIIDEAVKQNPGDPNLIRLQWTIYRAMKDWKGSV